MRSAITRNGGSRLGPARLLPLLTVALGLAGAAGAATTQGAVAAQSPVPGPVALPAPPFPATAATPSGSAGLTVVSTRRNAITDDDVWVSRNGLAPAALGVTGDYRDGPGQQPLPAWAPRELAGAGVVRALRSGGLLLVVYGPDFASGHLIAGFDATTHQRRFAFDLAAWAFSPATRAADRGVAYQELRWAAVRGGVLYVESAHSTYAATSGGRTAYISALDIASGKLRWRSPALVANAQEFVLAGDRIVAGYGFTREPDFLTVLDARSGRLLGRVAVRSGPGRIVPKGSLLYVRTYDTDVVARLR